MLDIHRIRTRTKEIRKRLLQLEKFKKISENDFTSDEQLNAVAERNLQVAIQACIDIANHIVASLGLDRPFKETAEVFDALAREKIISKDFVSTMKNVIGYRNVVVHDYLEVDRHITYRIIQANLTDLSEFVKYIEAFLEKRN